MRSWRPRALTKTDDDKADLYIGYHIALSQDEQWNAYGTGGMRWGGGMATATQSTITTGSLTLDMYEPGTKSRLDRLRYKADRYQRQAGQN